MSKGSEAGRLVGRTNLSKDRGDRSPQSQWAWVGGEAGEAGRGQSAQGLETTMKGGLWQDSGRRILGQEGLGKCQLPTPAHPRFLTLPRVWRMFSNVVTDTEVPKSSHSITRRGFRKHLLWDFPGGPVVKTSSSQCRRPGFHL